MNSAGDGLMATPQRKIVLYDARTNRSRLIDFRDWHEKSISRVARQTDDLLVFLLDMVGIVPSRQWIPFALAFLEGASRFDCGAAKQPRLPGGLAWIWWACARTSRILRK
jgi:hypothetical protein